MVRSGAETTVAVPILLLSPLPASLASPASSRMSVVTVKSNRPCAVSPCGQTTTWLPARDSPAPSASAATVASHICCPLVALRSTIRSEQPPGVGRLPLLVVVQSIGRASGREVVCQYVWISGGAVSLKKKKEK